MEDTFFICPICKNKDTKYIGIRNGKPYCRKCIEFNGNKAIVLKKRPQNPIISLNYDLSSEQKDLSKNLLKNFINHKNSLVNAVCGSGKTEIVLETIQYAISNGMTVGFAIPRKDVVIEITERLKEIFKTLSVCCVVGGQTEVLDANIICLTTHQLYRYEKAFDLLILDEIDAFPYKDNELLQGFFKKSLAGYYIYLSATPSKNFVDQFIKEGGEVLTLNARYHRKPLPVPLVKIATKISLIYKIYRLILKYQKQGKPLFVFCPTIVISERLFKALNLVCKGGALVHSKIESRSQIINDFKKGRYRYLVTTSVLERGVTVKDLQVIVYLANHFIYDQYSLTQIAGRVGRKIDATDGDVVFLATKENDEIKKCIETIQNANKSLQNLL